ncbi:MAG TPA: beta-galactosidase trimerization domain-containing protein, partial [Anaerolineae bacterium]|nr:beta-galactosidase trimerization domain-containing protein [Anaerolineae bacterium]
RYHHLGDMDLIGELAHRCRERGLRFVPWWLATATGGVRRVLEEHPSWQLLGPSVDGQPGERHNYICYNSPYRELIYEEVREVLSNYEVDGIYFDQLPGSCYCPWCQAKFQRRYNQPLPVVPDEFLVYDFPAGLPPLLKEFRDESVRSFCAGIRQIVDAVRPGTCYAQNWVRNQQAYLARGYADVLLPEFYQQQDLVPLGLKHRVTKAYFDHGAIWGNVRHSVRHDARHHPVRGTKMLLVDCIANLAAPLMLDLCAMDFDATGTEELAETFDHMRAMQEFQAEAEPVRYAALLHSFPSYLQYGDRFEDAFEGMYRLLLESHVPFDVVNEAGLQRGELKDYRVLVIPDAVALADGTVQAIREAVKHGLGLVATYMTGLFDAQGNRRAQPALADLFGFDLEDITAYDTQDGIAVHPVLGPNLGDADGAIFHYGSARSDHHLAQGIPDGALFSFKGGYVICSPAADVEVIADIHAADQVRLNSRPYNRRGHYPGPARWPLALAREVGKARLAYYAPQAEAEWRRAHAPELDTLLLRSILWAGGPPPLEAPDCPRSVEVRLFHSETQRAYHIMLVNLTTNPLVWMAKWSPSTVRYVTPHKGVRLALRVGADVTSVRSLIGSEVGYTVEEDMLLLDLPLLDLYESIVVQYD